MRSPLRPVGVVPRLFVIFATFVGLIATILPGSLPYKVITNITTAPRYATLPDNLRHQFQYRLYADAYQRNIDNPTFSYQQSLPSLAGKKVTLSLRIGNSTARDEIQHDLGVTTPLNQVASSRR